MTVLELEKRVRSLESELEEAKSAIRRNAQEVTQTLSAIQSLREETSAELQKIIHGIKEVAQKAKNPVSVTRG